MNKLLIAATLALTLGAQVNASDNDPCEKPGSTPKGCALVYNLAINVKTTAARAKTTKEVLCDKPSELVCYRVKANRAFRGFVFYCSCDCGFGEDASYILWENKTRLVQEGNFPFAKFWRVGGTTVANSPGMELEWDIAADEEIGLAGKGMGYGNWNKVGRMQNGSGTFVGSLPSPVYTGRQAWSEDSDDCDCVAEVVVCEDGWAWAAVEDTIAFGSWKIAYNAAASVRYFADGGLPLPKWLEW
jgi:hypothetical protein